MSENDDKNQYQFTWIIRNYKFGDAKLFGERGIRSPPFTTDHIGQATWYLSIREFSPIWEQGVNCYLNRLSEDKGEEIVRIQWSLDFREETDAFHFGNRRAFPVINEFKRGSSLYACTIYTKKVYFQPQSLITLVCHINSCTPVENPSLCTSCAETHIKPDLLYDFKSIDHQTITFSGVELKYDVSSSFQYNDVRVFIRRSDNEKAIKCYFMYGDVCFQYKGSYTREDIGWWKPFDSGEKLEIKTSLRCSAFQNSASRRTLRMDGLFVISAVKEKDCKTVYKNQCDIVAKPKLDSSGVLKDSSPPMYQSNTVDETKLDSSEVLKEDLLRMCNRIKFADFTLKDYQTVYKNQCDIFAKPKLDSSDVLKDSSPDGYQSGIAGGTKLDSSEVLKDDLLHMFRNKKFADVTLNVDNQNFPAHKCLLASRSPVFSIMFDQDMTENHTGIVTITDIDANTINLFLQYLYTSKFDKLCVDSALNLLLAAEKYEVPSLKGECASYLLSHLSDDNVCEVLAVADMISHHHLKSSSMSYIKKHADKVLLSDSWKHLCTKNVQLVSEVFLMMSKEYGNALGGK